MAESARRRALGWIFGAVSAGLAALYAVPALVLLRGRRRPDEVEETVDLGPLSALPDGVPHEVAVPATRSDAWSPPSGTRAGLYLLRRGERLIALDRACPHSGCAVDWDAATVSFRCPCHRSAFSIEGTRLGGPAPRDLDLEEVVVKEGRVQLRYRKYRPGRPDRVPV